MTTHQTHPGWVRFTVTVPTGLTDTIAAFLGTVSGTGVEISADPDDADRIITYLPVDQSLGHKKAEISQFLQQLGSSAPLTCREDHIAQADWNQEWKKHFTPQKVTDRLVIKPSWADYQAGQQELVIEMDPGMAFGTGHHASTRLLLRFLEQICRQSPPVHTALDIGTGTGILAMAAALLGCSRIVAVDNDPEAVAAARKNVAANQLDKKVTVSGDDFRTIADRFDLVLANIIFSPLVALAPAISDKVTDGGLLALSGILAGQQAADIKTIYQRHGLAFVNKERQGEWAALLFRKED